MYSTSFPFRNHIKKFECLEKNVAIEAFLGEVVHNRHIAKTSSRAAAHRESNHIHLRVPARTPETQHLYHGDILKSTSSAEYATFPRTAAWLEAFADAQNATLERVMVALLKPHGTVHCHFDAGRYYASRERYHLVLQSEGTRVLTENEERVFNEGDVWWFNNRLYHEFSHNSDKERIHLIFDLRPKSVWKRLLISLEWNYLKLVHALQHSSSAGAPPRH